MHRNAMHSSILVDDYLIKRYAPKAVVTMVTRWMGRQTKKERDKNRGVKPPLCKYRPKAGGFQKLVFAQ